MEGSPEEQDSAASGGAPARRRPGEALAAALAETQHLVQARLLRKKQSKAPSTALGTDAGGAPPLALFAPFYGLEARYAQPEPDEEEARSWGLPGWRVFAARAFEEGAVVERCELLPARRCAGLEDASSCIAARYVLYRDRPPTSSSSRRRPAPEALMPLGYCPLYRRGPAGRLGEEPELRASWSADGAALVLSAPRALTPGEELWLPSDLAAALGQPDLSDLRRFGPPKGRGEDELDEADLEEVFRSVCLAPGSVLADLAPPPEESPDAEAAALHDAALEEAKEEALRREKELAMRPVPEAAAGGVRGGWSPVHGRGVFALVDFRRGDLVELCPALRLDKVSGEVLEAYCMNFRLAGANAEDPKEDVCVLSLSCGALFNHSMTPSIDWNYVPGLARWGFVAMTALEDIRAGEELFICYGDSYFGNEEYLERDGSMQRRAVARTSAE